VTDPLNAIDADPDNWTELVLFPASIVDYQFYMPYGVSGLFDSLAVLVETYAPSGYVPGAVLLDVTTWEDNGDANNYTQALDADQQHIMVLTNDKISENIIKLRVGFIPSGLPGDGSKPFYIRNVCAVRGYSRDVAKELFFSVQGRPDDVSGTVTGTASALIEKPAHVVESIERSELGLAAAEIDTAAFDAAATEQAGMKLAFQLLERDDSYDTIDDIGRQSRQIFWWDSTDRLTVMVAGSDAGFPNAAAGLPNVPGNHDIFTRTGSPVSGVYTYHPIFAGPVRKPVDISRVRNDFVVKFGLNLASGEYAGVLTCNKDGCSASDADLDGVTAAELADLCAVSYARVGTVNTRELLLWAVYDEATAARTLQHYVQWETKRREEVELVTGHNALQVEPGDEINIREERIEEGYGDGEMAIKKWMVVGISPELNGGRWGIKAIEI
jgi:hypothetical protein